MADFEADHSFECPTCAETNEIRVDLTAGKKQKFVVDCAVCCHPILIRLETDAQGVTDFSAENES